MVMNENAAARNPEDVPREHEDAAGDGVYGEAPEPDETKRTEFPDA